MTSNSNTPSDANNTVFSEDPMAMALQIHDSATGNGNTAIVTWSEDKKREFVGVFDQRVKVAQAILLLTAIEIQEVAQRRQFISAKHIIQLSPKLLNLNPASNNSWQSHDTFNTTIGGRSLEELKEVARERAAVILKELPPLAKAIEIIDADTAAKMRQVESLREKGQELTDQLETASETISMAELSQDMTIGAFREMVKGREALRRSLVDKLNAIAAEGRGLEDIVAKRLYKGLPGLTDAVVAVIKDHYERAQAFSTVNRRVSEEVQFGDSAVALRLLKGFEKDEPEVGKNAHAQFKAAMDKLKEAGRAAKLAALAESGETTKTAKRPRKK